MPPPVSAPQVSYTQSQYPPNPIANAAHFGGGPMGGSQSSSPLSFPMPPLSSLGISNLVTPPPPVTTTQPTPQHQQPPPMPQQFAPPPTGVVGASGGCPAGDGHSHHHPHPNQHQYGVPEQCGVPPSAASVPGGQAPYTATGNYYG